MRQTQRDVGQRATAAWVSGTVQREFGQGKKHLEGAGRCLGVTCNLRPTPNPTLKRPCYKSTEDMSYLLRMHTE